MLQVASKKAGSRFVKFYVMNADDLQFEDDKFDAVVDTFGLCSMEDPVRALQEMSRVCTPGRR